MFAAENCAGLGGGDPQDSEYNNRYQPSVVIKRVFHVVGFPQRLAIQIFAILYDLRVISHGVLL